MLCAGTLIQLQGPSLLDKFFFMGLLMKKPRMHVMIRAFLVDPNETGNLRVTIVEPISKKPVFVTSHQVFRDVLDRINPNSEQEAFESVSFVIHSYTVNAFEPLHTVSLTEASDSYQFKRQKQMPTKQTRLPFGLRDSPRKRKRSSTPMPKDGAKAKRVRSAPKTKVIPPPNKVLELEMEFANGPRRIWPVEEVDPRASAFGSSSLERTPGSKQQPSSSCSSDHSSSSTLSTSHSSDMDSDSDLDDLGQPKEEEQVARDPVAKEEERQTQLVLASHRALAEKRGELFCPRGPPETEQPPAPAPSTSHRSTGATFCNKEIGLVGIGKQVAARLAKCRHCGDKIARGSVRVAYSYNLKKFASYLHEQCAVAHLRQEKSSIPQALKFLQQAEQQDQTPEVLAAISGITRLLQP